jgi:DnaK suppressor protein
MAGLTKQQINGLARKLDARHRQLRQEIQTTLERSGEQNYMEFAGRVRDEGDDSVARLFADMNATMVDRDVQEIRDIEAAHKRIANGSYGVCENCGNEIAVERLEAYPTATRCIICQQQYEKTHASDNTPSL